MTSPVLHATQIGSAKPSRVYAHKSGHRCQHDGCRTILSMYNPDEYCSVHMQRRHFSAPDQIVLVAPKPEPETAPPVVRKPRPVVVNALGINNETIKRRRRILEALRRKPPGEWLLPFPEYTRKNWGVDIKAIRKCGYEIETRRDRVGGARLACHQMAIK